MTVRALIVDDEDIARQRLRAMLAALPGGPVDVTGEAANGAQALERITELEPELVFLDLRMPDMDGFEVLRLVPEGQLPHIIFVTGHDDFALQAFEVNAVDYLLKPVKATRLEEAVQRALVRLGVRAQERAATLDPAIAADVGIEQVLEALAARESRWFKRIPLQYARSTRIVPVDQILCVRVAEGLVRVRIADAEMRTGLTFRQLEEGLDPARFLRVHRSGIVNLDHVHEFKTFPNGTAILTLGADLQIEVSRSHVPDVRRALSL